MHGIPATLKCVHGSAAAALLCAVFTVSYPCAARATKPDVDAELGRRVEQVVQLNRTGKPREAIAAAQAGLALARSAYGDEHQYVALFLNDLGLLHRGVGAYDRAERSLAESLRIRKKILGEAHPDVATSLNNLAYLYTSKGLYTRAEPLYQQSLAILKNVSGDAHPAVATGLNNLALLYKAMGDYARAAPLLEESLAMRRKLLGDGHPEVGQSLNNLGFLYQSMGDYERAEPLYRQSLAIRKEHLGPKHPDVATGLHNLGTLYWSMGDYARAEAALRQALTIRRRVWGDTHVSLAASLDGLGLLYQSMGDRARAEPLLRQSLETRRKLLGATHPDVATSLNNLGALYWSMGDAERAGKLFREALALRNDALGDGHPQVAASLNNLGLLYESTGDYDEAASLYHRSLSIWQRVFGDEHPYVAASLNNLGFLYQSMGDYDRAEPLYVRSLTIREKLLGEAHPDVATTRNNLGVLHWSVGDYARAAALHRQSLESRKLALGERHPDIAQSLNNLGALYWSMNDVRRAEASYRASLSITRQLLEDAALIQSERQQLAMGRLLRYRLDGYASLVINNDLAPGALIQEILEWKGATLARQRAMRLAASDPAVSQRFDSLQQVTRRLSSLANSPPADAAALAGWRQRMEALTKEKERLEARLSRDSAAFRSRAPQAGLDRIRELLPDKSVLIDYLQYNLWRATGEKGRWQVEPSILATVIKPGAEPVLLNLGPAAPVGERIDAWRETFGMSPAGRAAGRFLRDRLWRPLRAAIGDAALVLASTDGVLGRLPLGALPGREDGSYLLEAHRLAVMPVPRLLSSLAGEAGESSRDLLLVGDVDYDSPRAEPGKRSALASARGAPATFAPLPGTADEVDAIRQMAAATRDVALMAGGDATEGRFSAQVSGFRHVHIATHGFFRPRDARTTSPAGQLLEVSPSASMFLGEGPAASGDPGLAAGLVFAGANRRRGAGDDDGILTAQEIAFLRLSTVDTVVLSACETGLGEVAGGEGLLGIQRAFQVAGARTTVASLWQVHDQVTRLLMERFYRNLWERRLPALDALRDAQLWIMKEARSSDEWTARGLSGLSATARGEPLDKASPYFWAAFVLAGDWR